MSAAGLTVIGTLLGCLLVSAPLFVLIGVVTTVAFVVTGEVSGFMDVSHVEYIRELTDKPPLLAIPFFVLSGSIMSRGSIARRLVNVARAVFSGVPGGLGIATVAACMFFAAISGSSPVTVITIGGVMYPALIAAGYPDRFATGLVTSAGTLGILIPPSIPMIVYAIFASGSTVLQVEELFLAGVGPGLVIGGLLGGYCLLAGVRKGERPARPQIGEVLEAVADGFWSLMLPVVILGGIYSGLFNATEAAAVSVVYALAVELFVHRELKIEQVPAVIGEATVLMGSLLVIFAMAVSLNALLSDLEVPQDAAAWIAGQDLTPFTFMLLLNGFLLVVGCVMDIMSAILVLVPLLAPMGASMGIDPVHMGIVFIVNLELGYLTPPMGLNLFVSSSVFGKSLGHVIRSVVPFTGLLLTAVLLVTYVPTISLGPVRLLDGKDFYVPFPSEVPPRPASSAAGSSGSSAGSADDDFDFDRELERAAKDKAGAPATDGADSIEALMNSAEYRDALGEGGSEAPSEPAKAPDAGEAQGAKSIEELMRSTDYMDAFDD